MQKTAGYELILNPSTRLRRQADARFRACAGPGGTGVRMVCGGPAHLRQYRRRVGRAASKQPALGSTTSSSPNLLKWAHLRSIPGNLHRCRRMPPPCSPSIPHRY